MVDRISILRYLTRSFCLTLLVCNPLWADDTEIFFGRTSNQEIQPNVLFIIDGSGSMGWYDCANGAVQGHSCNDGTTSGTTTRLARMKSALTDVLTNTTNINAGLMRFSHAESGGRVTYPVSPIDQQLCGDLPCGEEKTFTARSRVAAMTDDAAQQTDGAVDIDDAEISINEFDGLSVENTWVGLRFPDLQIPQGATITDARLDFTASRATDTTGSITLHGEASADSAPYDTVYNNVSARSRTSNPITWNLPAWLENGNYESPDIAALIQPVVDQTSWCGGNALGLIFQGSGQHYFSSFDNGAANAPSLTVSFTLDDVSPATGGCTKSTTLARVTSPTDDATEIYDTWWPYTTTNSSVLSVKKGSGWWGNSQISGIRFAEIDVPRNSTILSASLILTTSSSVPYGNRPSIKVSAQNSATPPPFSTWSQDIRARSKTSSVTWNNVATTANTETTSPVLTDLVQTLVDKNEWDSGNPMVFILEASGAGEHRFVSYDGTPSKSATLKIEFQSRISSTDAEIAGPVTDVRTRIIEEIDSMVASGGTPSVGALLEAKNYFAGSAVDYGLNRAEHYNKSHLSPWFLHPYGRYSRVSVADSYTGGTVQRAGGCSDNALNAESCASEHITGAPVYISPIIDECQTNHIVLLTDGQPNADNEAASQVQALTGGTCAVQPNNNGTCGEEIAGYLQTTDLHSSINGDQNIITHTIGFNFTNQWLKDLASAGGGGFYTADSALELQAALTNILDTMQDTNTTFVAPGATVDNFSKLSHRTDIYLALFQPKSTPGWVGNLKRFDFSGSPARLVDANSNPAVDPETGSFYETSKSFWSSNTDGNDVSKGGAASNVQASGRAVYTYNGSSDYLGHISNRLSIDNISAQQLGLTPNDTVTQLKLINWALGFDVDDNDSDGDITDNRHHMGDPLHSQPVIVTYGGTFENPESVIYFGTNDGFLHGIKTDTGEETFSFIPTELLPNLQVLYENNPAVGKVYGMDGALSLWLDDNNNDGVITGNDKAMLFAGMRRGGRNYYALDVSDKNSPEFAWQINGGSEGFEELGQTWSEAIATNINYQGTDTKVLIFGGGYDVAQDNKQTRSPDNLGRAIYIVSATDGSLLWSGGATETATRQFDDMTYSFPATPRLIDLNGDDQTDQFYIGDMGGRIWRFDINNDPESDADLVHGGIIADLGSDEIIADSRRFYHTPDISLSDIDGTQLVNIAVGSGYQAHPLNLAIEDRFYLIRYPSEPNTDGYYGVPDAADPTAVYVPITENSLFDATSNILGEGTPQQIADAEAELANSHGWFIRMEKSGEKILGSSVTFDNKVLFSSYVPGGSVSPCSPEIGYGIFWAVNLWDATPLASENAAPGKDNRNKIIPGGGIPAPVQVLFIESGDLDDGSDKQLHILAISGTNNLLDLGARDLVRRVYWSEYPNF